MNINAAVRVSTAIAMLIFTNSLTQLPQMVAASQVTTERDAGKTIECTRATTSRLRCCCWLASAVCGNQQCEFGEECNTPDCARGCSQDCPAFSNTQCPASFLSPNQSVAVYCSGHGRCVARAAECSCYLGYIGNDCSQCDTQYRRLRPHGPCVLIPGSRSSCTDGIKNGNEEEIDCGGPNCRVCLNHVSKWLSSHAMLVGVLLPLLVVGGTSTFAALWCYRRQKSKHMQKRVAAEAAANKRRKSKANMKLRNTKKVVPIRVPPRSLDAMGTSSTPHFCSSITPEVPRMSRISAGAGRTFFPSSANLVGVDWAKHEKSCNFGD